MAEIRLADEAADFLVRLDPDHGKQHVGVPAHALAVDDAAHFAGFLVLLIDQDDLGQGVGLFGAHEIGAVLPHVVDQLVGDILEGENLFFRDAGQVVIEGAAVDNVLGGLADVGGVVHDDGGIARARADGLLAGGEHRPHHAGTAGADQQLDSGMGLHDLGGLHGGLGHRADQDFGAARRLGGPVDQVDGVIRGGNGVRVRVEDHAVARGHHADAVAQHRFAGVGAGGDAAHQAEGGHFHEGQAVVAGTRLGHDVLGAGGFVRHQQVLGGLMLHPAHAGFGHAQAGHGFGLGPGQAADFGDDFLPLLHRHLSEGLIAGRRGLDGGFHTLENPNEFPAAVLRGIPLCGRRGGVRKAAQNLFHDFLDLCFGNFKSQGFPSPFQKAARRSCTGRCPARRNRR